MTGGLAAATAAAACYGIASVFQAVGAQRTTIVGLDPRLFFRLGRQLPYLAGIALDLGGFALNVVALRSLPLFLVQSLVAASVGVTAVVAVGVLRVRLRTGEVVALAAMVVGLVLLAVSARPGPSRALSRPAQWALFASVPVVAAAGAVSARRASGRAAMLLAALAGFAFGGVGIAARGLQLRYPLGRVLTSPAAWSIVAFGVLAALLFATALQRGSVTAAVGVLAASETIVPSIVGVAVLGDTARSGSGAVTAAFGFALTLAGAVALAPYAQPLRSDGGAASTTRAQSPDIAGRRG